MNIDLVRIAEVGQKLWRTVLMMSLDKLARKLATAHYF